MEGISNSPRLIPFQNNFLQPKINVKQQQTNQSTNESQEMFNMIVRPMKIDFLRFMDEEGERWLMR